MTPVFRPPLTRDNVDITSPVHGLGISEEAAIHAGCDRIAPSYPATHASLDEVVDAESDDLVGAEKAAGEASIGDSGSKPLLESGRASCSRSEFTAAREGLFQHDSITHS